MKHFAKLLIGILVLVTVTQVIGDIEKRLYFASLRNRFNEFIGCATIISPKLAITAANVVKG